MDLLYIKDLLTLTVSPGDNQIIIKNVCSDVAYMAASGAGIYNVFLSTRPLVVRESN